MTKEQYEKLKEYIETRIRYAMMKEKYFSDESKEVEKELDKLMGFE